MKYFLSYLFLCCFLLSSCDPYRRINMRNQSDAEASILFALKKDSSVKSYFSISNDTSLTIKLLPAPPHNLAKMSFGSGKWTEAFIKSVADDLASITILHRNDSTVMNTEDAIWNYLMTHRKGFGKKRLEIVFQ